MGRGDIAPILTSLKLEVSSHIHAPAALPQGRYPSTRGTGYSGEESIPMPLLELEHRTSNRLLEKGSKGS